MKTIRDYIKIADVFGKTINEKTFGDMGMDTGASSKAVKPRPNSNSGRNNLQKKWDDQYGKTHDPATGKLLTPPSAQTTIKQPTATTDGNQANLTGPKTAPDAAKVNKAAPEKPVAPNIDEPPTVDTSTGDADAATGEPTSRLDTKGETPSATPRDGGNPGGTTTAVDPDANDPRGDQTNPPSATPRDGGNPGGTTTAVDPDANDPRGDQTNPPANQQGIDGQADAAAQQQDTSTVGDDPSGGDVTAADAAAQQQDSLAGKLDTTTPSLLDAYNNGGRKAMDSVKDLQLGLSRLSYNPNGIDGKYGRGTYAAVQQFQKANGLPVDGEAGPQTMAKLQELLNTKAGAAQQDTSTVGDDPSGGDVTAQDAQQDTSTVGDDPSGGDVTAQDAQQNTSTADAATGEPTSRLDTKGETPPAATTGEPTSRLDTKGETPVTPEEMQKIGTLLDKLEQRESGAPNAELDAQERGAMVASYDMSMRELLSLMESLNEAVSDLTDAEMQELAELIVRLRKMDSPEAKEMVARFDKIDTSNKTKTSSSSNNTGGGGANELQNAVEEVRKGNSDYVKQAEKALLSGEDIVTVNTIYMDGTQEEAKSYLDNKTVDLNGYRALRQQLTAAVMGYFNKKYNNASDTNINIKNTNQFLQRIARKHGERNVTNSNDGARDMTRDFSWDYNVTSKQSLKESTMNNIDETCGGTPMPQEDQGSPVSMNVTLSARGDQHVQDLIRMMQLAGAKDAAPVADMHSGPVDRHDDMVHMMKIADENYDEEVEEDWDNSPQEDYKDHEYMTKDLSGGMHRQKKAYAKAQDGDNAMAVESSIKEQLMAALEGKYTEGKAEEDAEAKRKKAEAKKKADEAKRKAEKDRLEKEKQEKK